VYLVWEGAEVATKESRNKWTCFCGHKEATEHFICFHLEYDHQIVGAQLRQDNENYDGTVI